MENIVLQGKKYFTFYGKTVTIRDVLHGRTSDFQEGIQARTNAQLPML